MPVSGLKPTRHSKQRLPTYSRTRSDTKHHQQLPEAVLGSLSIPAAVLRTGRPVLGIARHARAAAVA
eukprot:1301010-Alexandrium_andersonii.AAC.1